MRAWWLGGAVLFAGLAAGCGGDDTLSAASDDGGAEASVADATVDASDDAGDAIANDVGADAMPVDGGDGSPDAIADASPDATEDAASDAIADAAPDTIVDAAPDGIEDAAPDVIADAAPDATADAAPDAIADAAPDAIADAAPEAAADAGSDGAVIVGDSVLQRNKNPARDGLFVQPSLTKAAAATMHIDTTFTPAFTGNVFASPLYVQNGPGGRGAFIIVTESNDVFAFDETSGATLWTVNLGLAASIATSAFPTCGNVTPAGITGTPFIDLASRTIYLSSALGTGTSPNAIRTHVVHALSLDNGSERGGWPLDLTTLTASNTSVAFTPSLQNQRGSLIVVRGTLYVPFGGHAGDCGSYHGWLVAIPTASPANATAYATPAVGGGMWGPGGPSSDGTSVFAATGNTFGVSTWSGGEAILRFGSGATFSGSTADYFTPSNWQTMDANDKDMGGSAPLLIDVPGATPSSLVVALSKMGNMHLLDRANLGGVGTGNGFAGEGVVSAGVADNEIINAPAAYRTATSTYVVFHIYDPNATGASCPVGTRGDLVAIAIGAASPPTLRTAWCMNNQGQGSPIVTTTDGTANAIVWTAGAEGTGRLHGFDGDTGQLVFTGGGANDVMTGVRRFTSPIAANGRVIVAGDNHVYAFKP
jgi:hypothetical protein